MSFNLNKNGEPLGSSKKSNFDLSKSGKVHNRASKTPPYWLFAAAAILVIGGAAWMLTPNGAARKLPAGDTSVGIVVRRADATVKLDSGLSAHPETIDGTERADDSYTSKKDSVLASVPVAAVKPQTTFAAPTIVIGASFKAGSANPQITAKSILEIRKKMNSGTVLKIDVFGYASSEGNLAVNQSISQARADAYKKLLIKKGIAEDNITAQGKGIEAPVAPNDTESGRAKNRRVEVSLQ